MKTLITLAAICTALVLGDPCIADTQAFGVKTPVGENKVDAGHRGRGSYVETDRTSFYTSPEGVTSKESKGVVLNIDIKLLPDRAALYNLKGLNLFGSGTGASEYDVSSVYVVVPEYTAESLTAGDLLSKVPALSTEDEETIGILLPPFAYFAKKF